MLQIKTKMSSERFFIDKERKKKENEQAKITKTGPIKSNKKQIKQASKQKQRKTCKK